MKILDFEMKAVFCLQDFYVKIQQIMRKIECFILLVITDFTRM